MRLLIKRDTTQLMKTEGRAELDSGVPKILKSPRVVPDFEVKMIQKRIPNDDLIIAKQEDYSEIDNHLQITNRQQKNLVRKYLDKITLTGIWSGYRSVLVSNGNGGLYRLKGVSFNPKEPVVQEYDNGDYEVFGGQPLQSARFEKRMSDKFNKVLENEGIIPIMKCKGYWHYPTKVRGRKLAASVVEVEGDTRLDEFMFLIENYFIHRVNGEGKRELPLNSKGGELYFAIRNLYYDMGFATGRLKKLMDKNNQTWSADNGRSNAHIGNIVLYNGTNKVKLGFVDFDASGDIRDFSKSEIREMQKREYETIKNSAKAGPISLRDIKMGFLHGQNVYAGYLQCREGFINGFEAGYEEERRTGIRTSEIANGIDFSKFLEVFEVLRDSCRLVPEPIRKVAERGGGLNDLLHSYDKYVGHKEEKSLENYILEEDKDVYNTLNKNREYQKDLLSKYNDKYIV